MEDKFAQRAPSEAAGYGPWLSPGRRRLPPLFGELVPGLVTTDEDQDASKHRQDGEHEQAGRGLGRWLP